VHACKKTSEKPASFFAAPRARRLARRFRIRRIEGRGGVGAGAQGDRRRKKIATGC